MTPPESPFVQTRRQLLRTAAAASAITVVAPELLQQLAWAKTSGALNGTFPDGIASGDPTPSSIVLWTRLANAKAKGTVTLEVATDKAFKKLVTTSKVQTGPQVGGAVKAQVSKLKPYEEYFYRFASKGHNSAVGRFRTALPPGSKQPVNFAFWS